MTYKTFEDMVDGTPSKKCQLCGSEFQPKNSRRVYCSPKCRIKRHLELVTANHIRTRRNKSVLEKLINIADYGSSTSDLADKINEIIDRLNSMEENK